MSLSIPAENKRSLISFDINSDDTILCAGTEQQHSEAYLLFFDIRQKSLLGGYNESHDDDITQIRFHPKDRNVVASGSTDGLINVFDIQHSSEEDALQYCFNTESSVQNINWHRSNDKDVLSCITHTNDFHLYDVAESELIHAFERATITEAIQRKSVSDCYLINCHSGTDEELVLLAGSNSQRGECLRSVNVCGSELRPSTDFEGNKQIVRCSVFDEKVS